MCALHLAIIRRVRPGSEDVFVRGLEDFVARSMSFKGLTGVHVIKPPPESDCREYGIMRSFENREAADAFYASELFQTWAEESAQYTEGESIWRELDGLEVFFRNAGTSMPPKWKVAAVTWLGVFPSVLLWSKLLPPFLGGVHWLIATAIVTAFVVVTLAWGVMPILTHLFHNWLHGKVKPFDNKLEKRP